jgi:predicted nuclease of predicted toxin-antitoxin system
VTLVTDEDIWAPLVEALRGDGHEVYSIQELHQGLDDIDVLHLAFERDELLLTRDKGYGEKIFINEFQTAGIFYLRLHEVPEEERNGLVLGALRTHGMDLKRKFTVLSRNDLRIRDIEYMR